MFVIRLYYARGYIYGVNGIFTQPNISNKGQNSELGWWLYLNGIIMRCWYRGFMTWDHGIMTCPCWFQNWLHQMTHISSNCCTCFGSTYTKIGTIQRRLAWPLRKDDTQNREAFHIFWLHYLYLSIDAIWFDVYFSKFWKMSQNLQVFESLEGSTHAGSNQVPIPICLVLNLSVDLIVVSYVLTLQWIIF